MSTAEDDAPHTDDELKAPGASGPNLTDLGNAERFAAANAADLRYIHVWRRSLVWDGKRWADDDTGEVMRRAARVPLMIAAEAASAGAERRKELWKWAHTSEGASRLAALVELAKSRLELVARPGDFDRDAFLLNVENGTIDLRTGKLGPHRRADLITKLAAVRYEPTATCPIWEAFLARVLPPLELRAFFQRAIGYSLTADTTEHALFLAYGTGANGKTTALDTIARMLGDYAKTAEATAFLAKEHDSVRNDLAALVGARLVLASETEDGRRMGVALVKQLTGGDALSVRFLYAEFFQLVPQFKPWIATNYRPIIRGSDEGIWRRVKLIPFTVTIPEAERDTRLPEKLRAELPGILRWAVEGCREWLTGGLKPSAEVRAATAAYREDMDPLRQWIADACALEDGAKAGVKELFESYTTWCKANGDEPLSKRAWGHRLDERGLQSRKNLRGARERDGITLASEFRRQQTPEKVPVGAGVCGVSGANPGNFPYVSLTGEFPEQTPQTPDASQQGCQPEREPGSDDEDPPEPRGWA